MLIILGVLAAVFCAVTLGSVIRGYRRQVALPRWTAVAIYVAYALLGASVVAMAYIGYWPLGLSAPLRFIIGFSLIAVGGAIQVAALRVFGSLKRMSGLRQDRLVRTGIYRLCRNPQNLGWLIVLAGVAILGNSGMALLSIGVLGVVYHVYVVKIEEPYLLGVYSDEYAAYLSRTPRYWGWRAGFNKWAAEPGANTIERQLRSNRP